MLNKGDGLSLRRSAANTIQNRVWFIGAQHHRLPALAIRRTTARKLLQRLPMTEPWARCGCGVDRMRRRRIMRRGELVVEVQRVSSRRFEMSPLLVVYLSAGALTPFAGFGLLTLQARLERWDYERHAED